ncbi:hypothetical protein [Cupriavidus oxalaticus]|uniref:hypothetical protein n=1 Tax=Cupriavidus oxalaticus TaxID=96344 RepID=UPI0012441830|nr:hypothetical protein [Cupriavidus oxalaticus]
MDPNDPDPYRIQCCESCARWRRHPETGAGVCMAIMPTRAAMALRDRALAAGNCLNRCAHFVRSTTTENKP